MAALALITSLSVSCGEPSVYGELEDFARRSILDRIRYDLRGLSRVDNCVCSGSTCTLECPPQSPSPSGCRGGSGVVRRSLRGSVGRALSDVAIEGELRYEDCLASESPNLYAFSGTIHVRGTAQYYKQAAGDYIVFNNYQVLHLNGNIQWRSAEAVSAGRCSLDAALDLGMYEPVGTFCGSSIGGGFQ